MLTYVENQSTANADRVRRKSPVEWNQRIDQLTESNIQSYVNSSHAVIQKRIDELDEEWDVERVLEVNASTLALTGFALGVTVNRKWLALPAVVMAFLLQHGVQGWCPPLPLLRRLGVRTRGEIDREKYALKALMERR